MFVLAVSVIAAQASAGDWESLRLATDRVRVFEAVGARPALVQLTASADPDVAAAAHHVLARLEAAAENPSAARAHLDAALPRLRVVAEPAARFAEVEVLASERRYGDALETLSRLRATVPDFRAAQAGLLASRLAEAAALGDRGVALTLDVLSVSRVRLPADELLARAARLATRPDEARRLRERLVTSWPESPLADEALALLSAGAGPSSAGVLGLTRAQRLARVRTLFTHRAYERCRDEALALWDAGFKREEVGFFLGKIGSERLRDDPHGALRYFGPATAVGAPHARDALDSMAIALAKTEQHNAALRTFDLWLARYGDEPLPEDAKKRFQEEIVRDAAPVTEVLEVVYDRARMLHGLGRSIEAARALDAFLKRQRSGYDRGKYLWFAAYWRLRGGQPEVAAPLLERLSGSSNALVGGKAMYWLGRAAEDAGRHDEAVDRWTVLSEAHPLTYYAALGDRGVRRLRSTKADGAARGGARPSFDVPREPSVDWPPSAGSTRLASLLGEPDTARWAFERARGALVAAHGRDRVRALELALAEIHERHAERRAEARRRHTKALSAAPTNATVSAWREVYPRAYSTHVVEAAKTQGVPEWMVYAHMLQESRFKPWMISGAPAFGLLELLDRTARRLADERGDEYQRWMLLEPRWNIRWAGQYLGALIRKFDGRLALAVASYNGGPKLIEVLLSRTSDGTPFDVFVEDMPTHESRNYLRKVIEHMMRYAAIWGGPGALEALEARLFPEDWEGAVYDHPSY